MDSLVAVIDVLGEIRTTSGRVVIDRVAEFLQGKVVEDMMAVIIENPKIVLLLQISHDDIVMISVFRFDCILGHRVCDKLFDALGFQFVDKIGVVERCV
jgi:hypothetical protein